VATVPSGLSPTPLIKKKCMSKYNIFSSFLSERERVCARVVVLQKRKRVGHMSCKKMCNFISFISRFCLLLHTTLFQCVLMTHSHFKYTGLEIIIQ
jgi:hypothetical protein